MTGWVYGFGGGAAEGRAVDVALLGGKGANLAEMSSLGLPVPPGFTLTTEVCAAFLKEGEHYPEGVTAEVEAALRHIESLSGLLFGDVGRPLLVSVRSGARASMPGMMDTVLNLGLNDATVEGLAERTGDARFAYDSYRRFIQMYADIVLGVDHAHFEDLLEQMKREKGTTLDTDLDADDWRRLIGQYKSEVRRVTGADFPQDVKAQLWGAIGAVFRSWHNARAATYRRLNHIPDDWGTAVNVQAMVFGNMGEDSATGVAFTRNPSTGEREGYGEYLLNAQGEDVVAGIRTPRFLSKAARLMGKGREPSMEEAMPTLYAELIAIMARLEAHYRDMQDIEFTVQRGRLWILQTRNAKRTLKAAMRAAVDMAREGLITEEEAILRVDPSGLDQLLHAHLDPAAPRDVIGRGLPASPGAASGHIVFDAEEAEHRAGRGEEVLLLRMETSPEDVNGMHAAKGILTSRGGMTSHAAVVARGMGRPCVAGAGSLTVDVRRKTLLAGNRLFREGDILTIDGTTGEVMAGTVPTADPELSSEFAELMEWADGRRRLAVRANAETPEEARIARKFGAEGIGLCRTEHMFFAPERIRVMREMILAEDAEGRRAALEKIAPMQKGDFTALFSIMAGLPVTIRLLDPPLHEFLSEEEEEMEDLAHEMGLSLPLVMRRQKALKESNPMLGHRGCRLGITYPEIYEMQARAIFEAAIAVREESGETVIPEIMIPFVATQRELDVLKAHIETVAAEIAAEAEPIPYLIGTMIELPRAALQAGNLARSAEFFSFGTNDLTQATLGISRDDAGHFLGDYLRQGIFPADPFVAIDEGGVGELITLASARGRQSRPGLKLGVCGEHGGNPQSIRFFEKVGLDYISCSPYRVPIARLAAAQAVLG
jgi:pyruvate,orthophosphate dikinase